jgi:hypothetical protein
MSKIDVVAAIAFLFITGMFVGVVVGALVVRTFGCQ